MAWERRGNRHYYYRSRKIAGRVVREYVGGGVHGEVAAALDAGRRQERERARAAERQVQEQFRTAALPHQELERLTTALLRAALTDAGYHQHDRGAWRKRRDHTVR